MLRFPRRWQTRSSRRCIRCNNLQASHEGPGTSAGPLLRAERSIFANRSGNIDLHSPALFHERDSHFAWLRTTIVWVQRREWIAMRKSARLAAIFLLVLLPGVLQAGVERFNGKWETTVSCEPSRGALGF